MESVFRNNAGQIFKVEGGVFYPGPRYWPVCYNTFRFTKEGKKLYKKLESSRIPHPADPMKLVSAGQFRKGKITWSMR